jgi:hypothetical protein
MKPNCYQCKHRGDLPGDAHSRCRHPAVQALKPNPLAEAMTILGAPPGASVQPAADELEIRANFHGIKKGWFRWPYNFDPVWLEHCNGFEEKTA